MAMRFGCLTNCLPAFFPARFARVVAAYSAGVSDLIAFSGKYLSPVLEDGLPDFVLHLAAVHAFRLCCGALSVIAVTPKSLKIFYGVA